MKNTILSLLILCSLSVCGQTMTNTKAILTSETEFLNVGLVNMTGSQGFAGSFIWPRTTGLIFEDAEGVKNQYRVEFKMTKLSALEFVKNNIEMDAATRDVKTFIEGDHTCCTAFNDWFKYTIDLSSYTQRTSMVLEYAMGANGLGTPYVGYVEIHIGSISGPLLAKVDLPFTGGWTTFKSIQVITNNSGILPMSKNDLYFVFNKNQIGHGNFKAFKLL